MRTDERRARWDEIEQALPRVLIALTSAPAIRRGDGVVVPARPGVYLLSEGSRPIYVGQTRNLRRRLAQHASTWAKQNQASFAFSQARVEALTTNPSLRRHRTRAALADDPEFALVFSRHRERVAAMVIQYVEVSDPELRTVFEVYAAVILGTENTFETH